ncbi:IS110 family transposase [Ktedonobacter sp. SOSP1-52]|uniref:IS110 family transposase n=1 Tax=Ktedonobacter sp. SOSP1-52 TaxID=2778366 RepID=UPI001915DAA2|nr:IS110 family transposase [Ktedonobacter sp. SOSP1-52]GHO61111.1 IS110 family transposase [Ktedonobacter sp. SOSP1-52]
MANRRKVPSNLSALPMFRREFIYIGVDIGKFKHVAGFISKTLLERHQHFEHCPAFVFEQSREGFRALVERIRSYCPLEHCFIVMEQTGHYHRPLLQYLLELDIPVYVMHVQNRQGGMLKTDKRDALGLANHLYNQLALGVQVENKLQAIRRAVPPSEAAAQLKGLMRHRYELAIEATQRKNKLTAICDELFPEFTQVFKNPNLPTALDLREKFSTPHAVATATLVALRDVRKKNYPSEAQLILLQQLAAQSIGTKNLARQRGLLLEQELLIKEMRLIQEHMERLDMEIAQVVEHSREGQILLSIPPICPMYAAAILATIGHIANFEDSGHLKAYFGWAPKRAQTGASFDRARLTQGGSREMKKVMYLVAWNAVKSETEWASLYKRLVPRLCTYDERTQTYKGRGKALGHVIGRLITLIYALLKQDDEILSHLSPGAEPPEPILYDPDLHKRHRTGHYRPIRKEQTTNRIVQVEP